MLTLKDKLSLRAIEYFALVLEQQYSITKLLLLHEDEFIQKVNQWIHKFTHNHAVAVDGFLIYLYFIVLTRWCRKKTPMTTDVCSGCVSSRETPWTYCRMTPLPLSTYFYRLEKLILFLSTIFSLFPFLVHARDFLLFNIIQKVHFSFFTCGNLSKCSIRKTKKTVSVPTKLSCISDIDTCSSVL